MGAKCITSHPKYKATIGYELISIAKFTMSEVVSTQLHNWHTSSRTEPRFRLSRDVRAPTDMRGGAPPMTRTVTELNIPVLLQLSLLNTAGCWHVSTILPCQPLTLTA